MRNLSYQAAGRHMAAVVLAVALAGSLAWGQSTPVGPKVGAVSQQAYAGAVAQANSGLQRTIKFGNSVFATETVRTGTDGSTELQFLDQARLHVGASSSLKLDRYSYDEASGSGSGLVEMFVGAYDFVSGNMKTDDKVKLVTPTVTIGLRGTALSINVAGDGRTDVVVRDGLVSLAPCRGGAVATLAAGHRASVSSACIVSVDNQVQSPGSNRLGYHNQNDGQHEPPERSHAPSNGG